MSDDFTPPPGDPGTLRAAAKGLMQVASDLDTQNTATKNAVATSVSDWHAPRADDFRHAGAGLQAELALATTSIERVAELLGSYAAALETTQQQVASYRSQAAAAQSAADRQSSQLKPDDPEQDRIFQHAAARQGSLMHEAGLAKAALVALAGKVAAQIDTETDAAVPGSAGLSPDELRRRVDSSLGVAGLQGAAAGGTLTPDQAWAVLASAQRAVPADAVEADGEVDWKKALTEFNDKYLGPPVSAGAAAVTPSEGWALYRLIQNQRQVDAVAQDLRTAFSEIVGPVAHDLDNGLASLTDLNNALIRFRQGADAVDLFGPAADSKGVLDAAKAGGLPDAGAIGALGKLAAVVGVAGDVFTLIDPGVQNPVEGGALRGAAGLNIVGTGMAFAPTLAGLVGINAVADWIPVAGQIIMVGTGLFLAGDWLYHHWDEVSHFVTDTVPHFFTSTVPNALGDAASATGHAFVSGAKAVGNFFSSLF